MKKQLLLCVVLFTALSLENKPVLAQEIDPEVKSSDQIDLEGLGFKLKTRGTMQETDSVTHIIPDENGNVELWYQRGDHYYAIFEDGKTVLFSNEAGEGSTILEDNAKFLTFVAGILGGEAQRGISASRGSKVKFVVIDHHLNRNKKVTVIKQGDEYLEIYLEDIAPVNGTNLGVN